MANSIAKKNEKYGDFYRRMDLLNELGGFYFSNGNISVARKYYDTLYIQSSKKDYLVGITAATSNLVPLLKKENKYNAWYFRFKDIQESYEINLDFNKFFCC